MPYIVSFFSCVFQSITSFGEERANLSAFRTFVRFVLVWICRFPLPLGVWERLRFVIVALPGISSNIFFICGICFCHDLFLISPFGASRRLCFVFMVSSLHFLCLVQSNIFLFCFIGPV